MTATLIDHQDLQAKVKNMYRRVAQEPEGDFHFEMGRGLAERLGYLPAELDQIPSEAVDSFAGVGYHFGLAGLRPGDRVLDLGSGSGMDTFIAYLYTGPRGEVVGLDMTDAQLEKAEALRRNAGFWKISYVDGYLDALPFEDASFDVILSNGVINLCADKEQVFREIARVLKPGGRMAISDIVTEAPLPENIVCNVTLWAACIGGAMHEETYRNTILQAGLGIERMYDNPQYRFNSRSAEGASRKYGVKSVSLLARKA